MDTRPQYKVHESILVLLKAFGYTTIQLEGVCEGAVGMASNAFHSDEENLTGLVAFENRVQFIKTLINVFSQEDLQKNFVFLLEQIATKAKFAKENNQELILSEAEQRLFELMAFLENLLLIQNPLAHTPIFKNYVFPTEFDKISPFTTPETISELGKLVHVKRWPGIFSRSELLAYLRDLTAGLMTISVNATFILTSRVHSGCMFYHHHSQSWICFNINDDSFFTFSIKDQVSLSNMIPWIYNCFEQQGDYVGFETRCHQFQKAGNEDKSLTILLDKLEKEGKLQTTIKWLEQKSSYQDSQGFLIQLAAYFNHADIIKLLIPFLKNDNKELIIAEIFSTALYLKHWDIVRELIHIINPHKKFAEGYSLIHYLLYYQGEKININSDNLEEENVKEENVKEENVKEETLLEVLLDKGMVISESSSYGESILHLSVSVGNLTLTKALLDRHKSSDAEVNLKNNQGETPLYLAVALGDSEIAKLLIKANADVNMAANNFFTPLLFAVLKGDAAMVRILVAEKADVNASLMDGSTAAMLAAENGYLNVIEILDYFGANFNLPNSLGFTPLLLAAARNHVHIIEELVCSGKQFCNSIDLNQRTNDGLTICHYLANYGNVALLKRLYNEKNFNTNGNTLNLDTISNFGFTPAGIAVLKGQLDFLKELKALGADMYRVNGYHSVVHFAASCGQLEILRWASAYFDLFEPDQSGWTAVHLAAINGQEHVLDFLTKNFSDEALKAHKTLEGDTLMHIAIQYNQEALFTKYLQKGFDLFEQNNKGEDAILLAVKLGNLNILKRISEENINLNQLNYNGKFLVEIALDSNQEEVKKFLELQYMQSVSNLFQPAKRKEDSPKYQNDPHPPYKKRKF